jgi:hypothetical protein
MNTNKSILITFSVRLILQLTIFLLNISPIIKIILIFLTDIIDYNMTRIIKFDNMSLFDKLTVPLDNDTYNKYQLTDKINDNIGYLLVHYIIYSTKLLNKTDFNILTGLFIYRLIGFLITRIKHSNKYFQIFVDLYKEFFIMFYFIKSNTLRFIIASLLILFKLLVEYLIHIKYNNSNQQKENIKYKLISYLFRNK